MSTVSNAVATRNDGPGAMVRQYADDFAQVLPSHVKPSTFVRLAQGVLRKDDKLRAAAQRNPGSFMAALMDCARLGHEPGTEQYALVPFGSEIQGLEQYQGKIERMYRAGAVASVKAEVVRANDHFHYEPSMDRPEHKVDWFGADRGKLIGVYAYAVMKDGSTSRVVVMNRAQVMEHKAMARGADKPDSPWNKWEEKMWLKSACHELEKWVPTSAEYLRDQARAAGEMIRTAQNPPPDGVLHHIEKPAEEPIRAEVVEPDQADWPVTPEARP
ncbi:MAG: recombinase RecT [Actinomycetota bacterium]|nr:recombinase RecT [Actinomycetota bacterium]